MIETLFGGALGGLLRLAPEAFKLWDRRNERAHELAMQAHALEFEKLRGANRMEEIRGQGDADAYKGGIEALKEAIRSQGQLTGVKWVDALSQLMRPAITFQWVLVLYPAAIVATFALKILAGGDPLETLTATFGVQEKAICAGIINFWFLDRVLKR